MRDETMPQETEEETSGKAVKSTKKKEKVEKLETQEEKQGEKPPKEGKTVKLPKENLLRSRAFQGQRDLLSALIGEGEELSIQDGKQRIEGFLMKGVR